MRVIPLRRWLASCPLRVTAPLLLICSFTCPHTWAAETTAFTLTTSGTLTAPGNDLPTVVGERLATSLAGEVPTQVEGGVLAEGDLLTGFVASFQAGKAVLVSGVGGRLEIPAERLAALIISPVPTANPVEVAAGFSGALLANGERVAGTPAFVNESQVGIDNGKRVIQIPRSRVAAVVIRPPIAPAKPCVRVRLAAGDRLSGVLTARDGAWVLRHALGEWTLPVSQVRGWWGEGPERTALTALPLTVAYVGDLEPPVIPLGVDRTADGHWLMVAQVRCDRGLVMRAGTTVTVDLAAAKTSWSALVAVLAIERGGPAAFRIDADGHQVFDSGALSPGTTKPITVPIAGAKSLVFSVISAQADGVPAHAVWGWTTLVK